MFLIFALITLAGAVALAFQRNLVVAGLCLVLSFMGVAGLFLLLANPVAAALQIIVYSGRHRGAGAVRDHAAQRAPGGAGGRGPAPAALGLGGGAAGPGGRGGPAGGPVSPLLRRLDNGAAPAALGLGTLGNALFSEHLVAFEAVGLLLLAAMVAAVALVKRDL